MTPPPPRAPTRYPAVSPVRRREVGRGGLLRLQRDPALYGLLDAVRLPLEQQPARKRGAVEFPCGEFHAEIVSECWPAVRIRRRPARTRPLPAVAGHGGGGGGVFRGGG